ncbi:MAG: DUF6101 family protein [Alphaproteobacteria bacterium]|nr:DUF6101 family protein [Alphaproteobacteria bacterium]
MRRQTATSGANPAGSGRHLRLDPQFLPLRFDADDPRADGHVRQVEISRERVVLHRALHGMRMAVNVRVSDFAGIALTDCDDTPLLLLVHRDPALSIPLFSSTDEDELDEAWRMWSLMLALPRLDEPSMCEPAARRRRRNAVTWRRPRFLLRRRVGIATGMPVHRGEREIIARH